MAHGTMYDWDTLLCNRNWRNIVNQLYFKYINKYKKTKMHTEIFVSKNFNKFKNLFISKNFNVTSE